MSQNQRKRQNWKGPRRPRGKKGPKPPLKKDIVYPDCALCGKTITDVYNAIATGEENLPAHFDCVIKELESQEKLQQGEKIYYLGNGSFGVVQTRNVVSSLPFLIKKRIQYENKENILEWRKEFCTEPTK